MSYNPRPKSGLGYFRFRSPLLTESIFFFLFLQLLRCSSSLGFTHYNYIFIIRYWSITTSGFPHSDISGSKITYISPKLFVVCHVLLHLLMPRHSPYALINLITIFCYPNLMRSIFSIKSFFDIFNIITLSSFQRTNFLKENTLSKLSKTFIL